MENPDPKHSYLPHTLIILRLTSLVQIKQPTFKQPTYVYIYLKRTSGGRVKDGRSVML